MKFLVSVLLLSAITCASALDAYEMTMRMADTNGWIMFGENTPTTTNKSDQKKKKVNPYSVIGKSATEIND